MIMRADGHPVGGRYSLGFLGSLVFHIALAAVVLSWAGTLRRVDSTGAGSGTARYSPRHSSALLRSSAFGGEPTGTMGAMAAPVEVRSWPVRQTERLGLRLGIGRVIDHLWQSTWFAIGAGLLTLAFRRNRARVRHAVWFVASVKFLVPFSMMAWLGSVMVSSALASVGAPDLFGAAPGSPGSPGSPGILGGASWSLFQSLARHPLIAGIGDSLTATGTIALWPSTVTLTEVTVAWLSLALLALWTIGFFAIVAYRVRLSRQLWDIARTSRRVELIDVKVPARLQVALADGLLEPGVLGWMNPVLLFPADIEQHLTRPEIEAIVAHELCHVRRLDNMTAAIHMVVEAIFWFHPLVWWLGARLVDERERACDEHVLRSVGAPGPYAQGILNVCKRYVESPLASVSGVGSANVRQRIEAILANRIGEATGPWKKVMLSALISSVLIVPLAAGALYAPDAALPDKPRSAASPLEGAWRSDRREPSPRSASVPSRGAGSAGRPALASLALVRAHADGRLGPDLTRASTGGPAVVRVQRGCVGGRTMASRGDASTASAGAATAGSDAARATEAWPCDVPARSGEISGYAITMPRLAALIATVLDREIEDRTGLTGEFTVRLAWTPEASGPSLFDAMRQQLGLQLVPRTAADREPPPASR